MNFQELEVLARTVYGEARGEVRLGKIAVVHCILNRVKLDIFNDGKPDWWGEGIIGVCKNPKQFSCWNSNDPMFPKLQAASVEKLANCIEACLAVALGKEPDLTKGATHYYASYIAEPKWAIGLAPTQIIGVHRFYKLY